MTVGRFYAGIATVIWSPANRQYLLLHRSAQSSVRPSVWECVTGRVDQGESFDDALHREVHEELGVTVQVEHILGTAHYYRGAHSPENELVGVVYFCTLDHTASIHLSEEHVEYRWLPFNRAIELLSAPDTSTQWTKRVIQHAETIRTLLPQELLEFQITAGFEFG
jgi:8-oxo-dGTP diphosphatase